MALYHMYRDANNEPAYMTDQVAEHNRIVAFYESERGQENARHGYEYWRDKFEASPSAYANRMRDIAGGLAGLFEPWMTKVGHLTVSDSARIDAPEAAPDPIDMATLAQSSEIDSINRGLSNRQEDEAA